eukprot:3594830-Pyramimonas_sp.AAC.1
MDCHPCVTGAHYGFTLSCSRCVLDGPDISCVDACSGEVWLPGKQRVVEHPMYIIKKAFENDMQGHFVAFDFDFQGAAKRRRLLAEDAPVCVARSRRRVCRPRSDHQILTELAILTMS